MALGVVVAVDRVVVGRATGMEVPVEVVGRGTVVAVVVDGAVVEVVVTVAMAAGEPAGTGDQAAPAARAKLRASFERHDPLAPLAALLDPLFATTGAQRGTRRSPKPYPPQMMPSLSALRTQGMTSSSISSSDVVASKPKTSFALSTEGTRLATSCSKGGSLT